MHQLTELIDRCTIFTLETLGQINEKVIEALQRSSATSLVKTLQMIQLQKVILSVGMFSIFEANLQDNMRCINGFDTAKKILNMRGKTDIKERFEYFYLAINVLKHGFGRSYDTLVAKVDRLPFKIKLPNESFFFEGDVSEVLTLIEVDDIFVQNCSNVIKDVSNFVLNNKI